MKRTAFVMLLILPFLVFIPLRILRIQQTGMISYFFISVCYVLIVYYKRYRYVGLNRKQALNAVFLGLLSKNWHKVWEKDS
jgi:hypothetical protein